MKLPLALVLDNFETIWKDYNAAQRKEFSYQLLRMLACKSHGSEIFDVQLTEVRAALNRAKLVASKGSDGSRSSPVPATLTNVPAPIDMGEPGMTVEEIAALYSVSVEMARRTAIENFVAIGYNKAVHPVPLFTKASVEEYASANGWEATLVKPEVLAAAEDKFAGPVKTPASICTGGLTKTEISTIYSRHLGTVNQKVSHLQLAGKIPSRAADGRGAPSYLYTLASVEALAARLNWVANIDSDKINELVRANLAATEKRKG